MSNAADVPETPSAPDAGEPRDSSDSPVTPTASDAPYATVVIPAFNEEKAIAKTLRELRTELAKTERRYEILVVDDGSSDATVQQATMDGVRVVSHRANRGYGSALKTGVLEAAGEIVVFYDADNQFEAEDVERVVAALDNADAALGARRSESYSPFSRRGPKKLLAWFANYLARQRIPDLNCGLRAVRRNLLLDYLHLWPSGFSASTTTTLVLLKEGYEVVFVPIVVKKRIGTSTVRPLKDGIETALLVLRLITMLDPMRVFVPTALVLFMGGLAWGLRFMIAGRGLSVAALFLLVSGVTIFFFGLLADQMSALRRERRYWDHKR